MGVITGTAHLPMRTFGKPVIINTVGSTTHNLDKGHDTWSIRPRRIAMDSGFTVGVGLDPPVVIIPATLLGTMRRGGGFKVCVAAS